MTTECSARSARSTGSAEEPATGPTSFQGRAVALAGIAMVLVGSLAGVSVMITDYPVWGGQAVRYAIAATILFAIVHASGQRLGRRLTRCELVLIFALAAVGMVAFNVFTLASLNHASPAVVGTVIATVPVVLAIVAPLQRRERPGGRITLAAVVVTIGAVVTTGLGSTDGWGIPLSIITMLCEAGFSLIAVPLIASIGPLRAATFSIAMAVPQLLVVGLILDGPDMLRMPTLAEAGAFAYIAVVVTVIAFLCWYSALPALGADRAGLFAGLIPVGAIAAGLVVGSGLPTYADLIGAGIVIVGLASGLSRVGSRDPNLVSAGPVQAGDIRL